MATLQQYESQIKAFSSQLNMLEQVVADLARSKDTLVGMKEVKKGQEVLLPVGQYTQVHAKLTRPTKAMVAMGSGVTREMDLEPAIEKVSERLTEAEKTMESYAQSLQQMQQQYQALSEQAEQAVAEARAGGAMPGMTTQPSPPPREEE